MQFLYFYDKNWSYCGNRDGLASAITSVTDIPMNFVLRGTAVREACVAKKMSWVSARQTSRIEDMAYCMLGLLDVNMPLLYGEGEKAFLRLQLEIIRKSDDESIFAWRRRRGGPGLSKYSEGSQYLGLLAHAPSDFSESGSVEAWSRNGRDPRYERQPYTMTNQGLQLYHTVDKKSCTRYMYITSSVVAYELNCSNSEGQMLESGFIAKDPIIINLRKESEEQSKYWCRQNIYEFSGSRSMYDNGQAVVLYVPQEGM